VEIGAALYTRVSTHAGFSALASTRLYPRRLPEGATLPAATYVMVTSPKVTTRDAGPASLALSMYQFTCYAATYAGARALAKQVRLALDGYSGTMGGASGVRVDGAYVADERDGYTESLEMYQVQVDVMLQHAEETS